MLRNRKGCMKVSSLAVILVFVISVLQYHSIVRETTHKIVAALRKETTNPTHLIQNTSAESFVKSAPAPVTKLLTTDKEVERPTYEYPATIPASQMSLIPQPSEVDGYLKLLDLDYKGTGDLFHTKFKNASVAARKCDAIGKRCTCFTYQGNSHHSATAFFKYAFGIPDRQQGVTLYLKKEFLSSYTKGITTNLTCAVPLKHFRRTFEEHPGCQLPELDPFRKEVLQFVGERLPAISCSGEIFTSLEKGVLRILNGTRRGHEIEKVEAQPFVRHTDFITSFGNKQILTPQNNSIKVNSDFWKVQTHFKDGLAHEHIHACVIEKPEVLNRKQDIKNPESAPLDIMMIMFDGTSRAHFERMLPESWRYIQEEAGFSVFKGHSIVGVSTTPNVVAMLTGNTDEELCLNVQEARRGKSNSSTVDSWPFIWEDLKKRGFATMLSEDQPQYGTFTYRLNGFKTEPTDHYGRPFWMHRNPDRKGCINSEPQFKIHLNYFKSFMESYQGRRKFGLLILSELCHRDFNFVSLADRELMEYLKSLRDENLLNETMLILTGDHGWKFGLFRETIQGKLEERLPFLAIYFPSWFRERYAEMMKDLQGNTDILSSHFDVHATLQHLTSQFPNPPPFNNRAHGISFLLPHPRNRTCAESNIPEQWCPCLIWQSISVSHAHVKKGAETAVQKINHMIESDKLAKEMCETMKLKKVLRAEQTMPSKETQGIVKERECSYEIQFQTSPGGGTFEALVHVNYFGDFDIYGAINRVNAYGDQPKCIAKKRPYLREYCYCKDV